MKTRFWLIAGSVLVLVLVILGVVLFSGKVRITQNLIQGEVTNDGGWYVSDFSYGGDGSGMVSAQVNVWSVENICHISVYLTHDRDTTVENLSLEFTPLRPSDALSVEARGGYFAQFKSTSDARGVIYSVPDTGFYGGSTLSFRFLLQKNMLGIISPGDKIDLHIDFTMHKDGLFKMTKQHGKGYISFEIP